jgi:HEPN domain-containing protein/predicted nucleotidyltransferase
MMLTALDQVIDRLITNYDPDRIILFGSRADDVEREGSDYDLLIIKSTQKRPLQRRIEVDQLLQDRRLAIDFHVYTPEEVWRLYSAGNPFILEITETGRVLYIRKSTKSWLAEAQEDLECASILAEHGKFRGACYHSQQCAEKGLKALLLEKGQRPARTHDLLELHNSAIASGWEPQLSMDELIYLNSIYSGRYPTDEGLLPQGEPLESDAHSALDAARGVLARIRELIPNS